MKNSILLSLIIISVLLVGGFLFVKADRTSTAGVVKEDNKIEGEVQKVVLSMKNYNYYPNTIEVKSGVPVELTLDSSVFGCLRSFTIRDLGVQKYSKDSNDKITFTPNKKGTFTFSCSMGMGYGKIIVK